MSADMLISRLEGVRKTGPGRWVARCPAHADRSPSLSIRELDDGRVLLHCFADCGVADVLSAVGLDFSALYPVRRLGHHVKPERRPFPAADVLACIGLESAIALDAAGQLRAGKALSAEDHARLVTAVGRIVGALDLVNG